jgi:hypothetical protein
MIKDSGRTTIDLKSSQCTEDRKTYFREYRRKWRLEHPEENKVLQGKSYLRKKERPDYKERYLKVAKTYRELHPERVRESKRKFFQKHKEEIREYKKQYYHAHIDLERERARRKDRKVRSTVHGRLRANIHRRMLLVLKGINKSQHTCEIIGCGIDELRQHLESQFLPGMTWGNWSRQGWHIDHIMPCASFDLSDPEQQRKCFNYRNLQPLWAIDNLKKGAKVA